VYPTYYVLTTDYLLFTYLLFTTYYLLLTTYLLTHQCIRIKKENPPELNEPEDGELDKGVTPTVHFSRVTMTCHGI
jgi:hypothetical protein